MKIIDADKLHYKQVYIQTEKGLRPALVVFAKEIRKMPEMVLCKDCKWASACYGDIVRASKGGGEVHIPLGTDGYCSLAERKEDETD